MKSVIAERVTHKGESHIALRLVYYTELIAIIKVLHGSRWSQTRWHRKPDY